jgi:hypothetical protein
MFGQYFYHAYTRKFVVIFGTLFNNIHIERPKDDTTVQVVKVPLAYSSQDKMLARLHGDPTLDRKVAAFSPLISYEARSPMYDASRKLQSTLQRCITSADGTKTQFLAVPYNIPFTLKIYAKEEEDGLRVLEQILPFFTPALTVTADLGDYKIDVPVVLQSVDFQNNSYGEYENRRELIWTIEFLMKAEFAGPVDTNPRKLIKVVHANINDIKSREIMEEVHVQGGLTANGEPTTSANNSIDPKLIEPDDDYGYVVQILEGPNPHNE